MKEKENIRENKWDKLLKIHTMGRDDSNADQYHYPYEPTPYSVLERDRIYFFNPFSLEILQKVMHKILESYYENPREMKLLFYYPSNEYIAYLMTVNELMFADEIDCRDLFQKNDSREKIVIFEL